METLRQYISSEGRLILMGVGDVFERVGEAGKQKFGGLAENARGIADGAMKEAESFAEDPAGKTREALGKAKEVVGGMQEKAGELVRFTKEQLENLKGKVDIAELKAKGVEYLQTIAPEFGQLFQDALSGGAKAVREIIDSPAVWDFFRAVLEKTPPKDRRALLLELDNILPGLGIRWNLHKAELAERILADTKDEDTAAHEEAVEIGMKEKGYGKGAKVARWAATSLWSPGGWFLRGKAHRAERKLIEKEYLDTIKAMTEKYPFLTEEMIRETVKAGVE